MKKQILLSLSLLTAVSCAPMQAEEKKSKSAWVLFKSGAKIIIGASFVYHSGIKTVIDAATFDKERALNELWQERDDAINQARQQGGQDLENRIALIRFLTGIEEVGINGRGSFGIFNALWVAGGAALIYSGVKGLTEDEPETK